MTAYIAFAIPGGTVSFYQPGGDAARDLARALAVDVWRHENILRAAYADHAVSMRVLVPRSALPADLPTSVTNATIAGVPMEVVDGLNEPMIAFSLKLTQMPT